METKMLLTDFYNNKEEKEVAVLEENTFQFLGQKKYEKKNVS